MKTKERIGRLKKRTKIVWCIGLIVIVLGVLSILILPPPGCYGNVCIKGTVIERGVLTTGGGTWCTEGKCQELKPEPKMDSYSIRVEKVYSGDVKVGDTVKVDEAGELEIGKTYKLMYYPSILKVKEKGSILWDSQSRKLKDFFNINFQKCFYGIGNSDICCDGFYGSGHDCEHERWSIFFTIPLMLFVFMATFILTKENLKIRLLTALFITYFVLPALILPFFGGG